MPKTQAPVDLLDGPRIALAGDIVAMDDALSVTRNGRLYLDKGAIVAIRRATDPAPAGFESISVLNTGGTIFPGLIELHNHLAYNALRLWQVPKKYTNRDQWSGIPEYRKLVSGPMTVVGKTPGLLPALIRYVEAKCLVGGVTTSQGIALFSNAGIRCFYRGIVRNVEETDDENLPEVQTRIADVEAQSAQKFLARLKRETCFLLHLSEGLDVKAREHFLALNFAPNKWAITPQLTGIHCAALKSEDFTVYGQLGGAMVWSPLSNLLLYGATANIAAAIAAGVRIGIGSDWSPSGSKNLLGRNQGRLDRCAADRGDRKARHSRDGNSDCRKDSRMGVGARYPRARQAGRREPLMEVGPRARRYSTKATGIGCGTPRSMTPRWGAVALDLRPARTAFTGVANMRDVPYWRSGRKRPSMVDKSWVLKCYSRADSSACGIPGWPSVGIARDLGIIELDWPQVTMGFIGGEPTTRNQFWTSGLPLRLTRYRLPHLQFARSRWLPHVVRRVVGEDSAHDLRCAQRRWNPLET